MATPKWVKDYVGIPFVDGGVSHEEADCWGLLSMVLSEQYGVEVDDFEPRPIYSRDPANLEAVEAYGRMQMESGQWIRGSLALTKPGDGILLRIAGLPMHVGIVVGNGWMLHTEEGVSSCMERYTSPLWNRRVLGVYRHADLVG